MADQILHVRPARPGLVVLLSDGSRLPEAGKRVSSNPTLRCHIKAGDVVLVEAERKTAKSTPVSKRKGAEESN